MKKRKKYLWLFVGPNGSGKGTVCRRMDELLTPQDMSFTHVESGIYCRHPEQHIDLFGEELAKNIGGYADKGKLVPDELLHPAIGLILQQYSEIDVIALDGYPRTLNQFRLIREWAEKNGRELLIVYMHTPMEECLARMAGRPDGRIDDADKLVRMNRIVTFIEVTCDMTYEMRHKYSNIFVQLDGTDARNVDLNPVLSHILIPSPLEQEELFAVGTT